MPELPEVETAVRLLKEELAESVIESVTVNDPKVISPASSEEFSKALAKAKITAISRKGKFVNITVNGEFHLIVHFRMTGALFVSKTDGTLPKYTRFSFTLSDGKVLFFTDPRRFGKVWLVKNIACAATGYEKLGFDALNDCVSAQALFSAYGKSAKAVKTCLIEQNVVCGIGNIYSDEILFYVKILPYRKAKDITTDEWEQIAEAIKTVISFYTEKNAIKPADYEESGGRSYRNTPYLNVYDRKGQACRRCGAVLESTRISNRTSVYCPNCQK